MRPKRQYAGALTALLLVTAVPTGCAQRVKPTTMTVTTEVTTEYTATVQSVQEDYRQAELQTEWTQDALHELSTSPIADLRTAADSFRNSADRMLMLGRSLVRHADGMHYDGETYLVEPEKQALACPAPKAQPAWRPAQLGGYFDPIADDAWEVKLAYRAYQFDLEAILGALWDAALNEQVTPKTIESVNIMIRKAQVDSEMLIDALEQAQGAIDQAVSARKQPERKG